MIVGPRAIFDKSFIQSLNGALIDELTLYFTPTCPPTLISEIIADLRNPPTKDGRIGEEMVRQLARKMTGAYGTEPPPLRSLLVGNLHGQLVPMNGLELPVMSGARGVRSNESGSTLIVSQIPQQRMWQRWEAGNFDTNDEEAATAWRAGSQAIDLEVERARWRPLAKQLGNPTALEEVVKGVDGIMGDVTVRTQTSLIEVALNVVRGTERERTSATRYFLTRAQPGTTLKQCAPFAAQLARLYLCFGVGMACDLLGTRRTNVIDLQYLCYAPFCRVFISNDNFHRKLWEAGAVTSLGTFVWGDEFRADLKQRNERRAAMTVEEWTAYRQRHGDWPEPIADSIVSALWERHCPNWPRGGASSNVGKTIDELDDPHLKAVLKHVMSLTRDD